MNAMYKAKRGQPLREWPIVGRVFSEMPDETDRPRVFVLLFWGTLVAFFGSSLVAQLVDLRLEGEGAALGGYEPLNPLSILAATILLVATWAALPWNPRASVRRKLSAPAFLVAVFLLTYLAEGSSWGLVFYLVAVANGVFLFGAGWGTAYAVLLLAVASFNIVLVVVHAQEPIGILQAAATGFILSPVAAFIVGVCATVVGAVRRREEMGQLLEELHSSHEELGRYAAKIKALTLSEERTRMAREMHDSVGHHMTVIDLQLEHALRSRAANPDEAWQEVGAAKHQTLQVLAEVRRAVRALKPPTLEEKSGVGALAALACSFEGTGFEAALRVSGRKRDLTERTWLVLYRAVQEGLTNAARHSGARRADVTLRFGSEEVSLTITDHGTGAEEGSLERGFGLRALEERVVIAGGSLLAGTRNAGFELEVRLPYGEALDKTILSEKEML